MFNLARVIGPALAGLVLATGGSVWCFSLNGVSFLAVIAGLLLMRIPAFSAPKQEQPVRQVLEGLEYTLRHPVILPHYDDPCGHHPFCPLLFESCFRPLPWMC